MQSNDIVIYNVKDIQNIFHCGKNQAYELVKADGFPSMRIGGKIVVEKNALENWFTKNRGRTIIYGSYGVNKV